jgi:hypothetical protein
MRDWWWPWWVSSLIDLGVVVVALYVLRRARRRPLRVVAGVFVAAGVVAGVLAPVVMQEPEPLRPQEPTPMSSMP